MNGPIALVKAHPIASSAAVIVVFGTVLVLTGGGDSGGTAVVANDGYDQNAAISFAAMQSQQQSQNFAIAASRDVAMMELSTRIKLAEIDSVNQKGALAANLELGKLSLNLEARTTNRANTLQAKLAADQLRRGYQEKHMQFLTLQSQIKYNFRLGRQSINAQKYIANLNKPKRGLFSMIFG